MKFAIALAFVFTAGLVHAADAEKFKIDPTHASVVFKINHLNFSNVYGQAGKVEGEFTINEKKPEKSTIQMTIDADSITTLNAKRDEHLHGPDFFNTKQFPKISFKSKSVKKVDSARYEVSGDMTMHGVTKPVSFTFFRFASGKDPWGNFRTGGETTFKIKRSDFGMNFMAEPGKVGDEVELMISIEGTKS